MNTNGTTGPIPISVQNANPLIFTLPQDQTSIRPYWIVIVQIIVAQQIHRAVNYLTHKSRFTPIEIGLICWIAKANKKIEEKILDPLIYVISLIIVDLVTQPYPQIITRFRYSELQTSYPRIIAFFIPYIQRTAQVKDISEISKRSCANQQRIEKLEKIYQKYYIKLKFGIGDCVHTLPLLGHSIWYCVIHSSCLSAEDATTWNCYGTFGYRLYNYVFPSYFHFCCTFLMKCAYRNKINEYMARGNKKKQSKFKKLSYYLGFCSSVITFIFVSSLVLPYFLTQVIPMAFTYVFIHIIYFSPAFVILIVGGYLVHLPCIIDSWIRVTAVLIGASILYTFPSLIAVTYNYSQYLFYGADYFQTMTYEHNTRDNETYFKLLQNSVNFVFHTVLNFF
jgi:hypothetical protein